MVLHLTHSLLRLLVLIIQIFLQHTHTVRTPHYTQLCSPVREATHLQEVGGGLRQLIGQKLEVVLVEPALQMSGHVLAVERAELADGAGERHPGHNRRNTLVSHKHAREALRRGA